MRFLLFVCALLSFSAADAANRYWVGSLFSNWNNILDWSTTSGGLPGASVPGSGDVAIFDNNSTVSCTIDAAVTISGITVNAGYTGAISQGANTITVSGAATFSGGSFTGGTANFTVSGLFSLSGTAFTSTSGILELRSSAAFTSGSFAHNNGTVRFNGSGAVSITGTSPSLYKLEFVGNGTTYTLSSTGSIAVANSLNLTGSLFYNLATGSINVTGDINSTNTATGCGGDATVSIVGTGTENYNGSGVAGGGDLPQLVINKASGTLNLANYPGVSNNFTYTAGTIAPGTSTFCFTHGNVGSYTVSGNLSLANLEFFINTSLLTVTIPTVTATGNLSIAGAGSVLINTGSINLNGNLTLTNTATGGGGTGSINFVGSGAQTADGTAVTVNQSRLPVITINQAGGTLSLAGNLSFASNVTYTAGTVIPGTSTCYIVNNLTMTGSFAVNNLTVAAASNETFTVASGSTVSVTGTLDLENGANYITLNTGTIAAQGNIIDNNTSTIGGGTATLLINGTGAQNLTSTGVIYQGVLPAVTINKPSGTLTLPSLITERSNWTYVAGTIDATTNNSTVVFGNTLTITGTHTLNNIDFDGGGNYTITVASGTALTAAGTVTIGGASNITLNTGTVNLLGNLSLTNTATAGGGSAVLAFVGTGSQAITGILSIYQSSLPAVTINKSSGTLSFPALITARGNWTYTAGTLDVTTNNSTVVFGNSLTISGNHTLNNIDFDGAGNYTYSLAATTLSASGNMSMSGTGNLILNNGTINLSGNLLLTNTATAGTGNTVIAFVAPVNQSIVSALAINQCNLPAVTINKPSGTLSLPALITVRGNWTYTAGTLDVTTNNSTVVFANTLTIAGTHTLNNVNLEGNFNNSYTVSSGTLMTVAGTLTTSGSSNVIVNTPVAGTNAIQAQGDVILNNTAAGSGGTGGLLISGTVNQALTGNAASGQGQLPFVKIQKTSGTLTMGGTITVTRNWTYTSGTVNPSTSTVVFGGNNLTVTSAGMGFNHVTVSANTISLGNALTVGGNLTISGAGVLAPVANSINLAGNWVNWGPAGFTEGTSTVNLNGAALQTVTDPGGENYYALTVNNSSGGVQLANAVAVASLLTMTQGNINLNGNNLTLGTAAATPGTLTYTAGTMIGTGSFTRWYAAATVPDLSASGLFPMGTAANYRPFYITAPSTAPTTGGTLAVAYNDAATKTAVSITDGASTIQMRDDLNWAVTASGLSGGSYNLDAQGTGFGTVGNVADLRLSLASSVTGTAGTNGGTVSNPQVNRTGVAPANLSNSFFVGSVNPITSPLPVTLVFFTAQVVNGEVQLNWATATETNNDYFTIERSADGKAWSDLSRVAGHGNSVSEENYTSYDIAPLHGQSFYRLIQVDQDGRRTYSVVVAVTIEVSAVSIYPNPAVDELVVTGGSIGSAVQVYNSAGKAMDVPIQSGAGQTVLSVSGLPKGMYFLRIGSQTFKFLKK